MELKSPVYSHSLAIVFFSTALFLSALLLFCIQPLIAKMLLPLWGGVPAVWNSCMVFFQGMLLAGYLYAYAVSRWQRFRYAFVLHVIFLVLACLVLPIHIIQAANFPYASYPNAGILLILLISCGLPVFMISTTAPLLQYWFSRLAHPWAKDPYFLYSASNTGSMIALLSYPLVIEPFMRLHQQNIGWAYLYGFLLVLISICGFMLKIASIDLERCQISATDEPSLVPTFYQRMRWILLAFAPSSLLLGTTTYVTLNVAAVPLLWVIPLALYILTFILVFAKHPRISHYRMLQLQPFFILLLLILPILKNFLSNSFFIWESLLTYLAVFFITAMVCHGELAKTRPNVRYLTEFYLWIAVGGLLGSLFNTLAAPMFFTHYYEYALALAVACMLRPFVKNKIHYSDLVIPCVFIFILMGFHYINHTIIFNFVYTMLCIITVGFYYRSLRFGLSVLVLLIFAESVMPYANYTTIFSTRNFYGSMQIIDMKEAGVRALVNGNIMHGAQYLNPEKKNAILTYYTPLKSIFNLLDEQQSKLSMAVVGLGTGNLACYARSADTVTFYEINPSVISLAKNPHYFSFLTACAPQARIILGDGRLALKLADPHSYDVIILDAFNSDAIPIHLMTEEAVQLYLKKLTSHGILVFHISNQYLNLAPVLSAIAHQLNLSAVIHYDNPPRNQLFYLPSIWVAMSHNNQTLLALEKNGWKSLQYQSNAPLWRDDFSNILGVLLK